MPLRLNEQVISERRVERDRAYAEAHIKVLHPEHGTLLIRPSPDGRVQGGFPDPAGRSIYIITAENPGRQLTGAENTARRELLAALLASRPGLTGWDAEGGDPSWQHREHSVAVLGLADDGARELGRRFEQESIFVWRPDALLVMDCESGQVIASGWSVTSHAGL